MIIGQLPAHLPFYWHLPILIVIVSVVYSATRYEQWPAILRESWRWMKRMTKFLVLIAIALYFIAVLI
jgi:hypothetical protein